MISTARMEKIGELHLAGVGPLAAASGIVTVGAQSYVVPDDGLALGRFEDGFDRPGTPVAMLADAPLPEDPVQRKRLKPDLESLAFVPADISGMAPGLVTLGSGSAESRRRGVLVPLEGTPVVFSLEDLYEALSEMLPDLNVEGVAVSGGLLRLVHRGNAARGRNAVIDLDAAAFFAGVREKGRVGVEALRGVREVDLGAIDAVPLTFTDVTAAPGGGFLFTAAAERTDRPYDDGEVMGSAIGWLDADGRVHGVRLLEPRVKVEGVDASRRADGGMEVRVVTDADDPLRAASVYRVEM